MIRIMNHILPCISERAQAHSFPLESYTHDNIAAVFQRIKEKWPDSRIEAAIWNAAQWSRIPFLEVKEEVSPLPVFREPQPLAIAHSGLGYST